MKKIIIVIVVCLIYIFFANTNSTSPTLSDDALRFRVIASSNSRVDQNLKMKIKLNVENKLSKILNKVNSKENAMKAINNNIDLINNTIEETMYSENNIEKFTVSVGKNIFPEKEYKGVNYPSGFFDSLVITLGDGLGENWWCVLFPPLCLLDNREITDVEYTFLVKEILGRYKNN